MSHHAITVEQETLQFWNINALFKNFMCLKFKITSKHSQFFSNFFKVFL